MVKHCQPRPIRAQGSDVTRRIAFIGHPNTGKSTFFNRVTKANSAIANWPGLTIDLQVAVVKLDQEVVECVDLPGIYDLNSYSDDERVVCHFLERNAVNLVVVVLNATQIDRQFGLLLQIKALGLPAIAILNCADEAKRYGVQVDARTLSKRVGVPIYPISAKYGEGCHLALQGITQSVQKQTVAYQVSHLRQGLAEQNLQAAEVAAMLQGVVNMPSVTAKTFTHTIDGILLHPLWGMPIFFASMFGIFRLIWSVGLPSADVVDAVTGWLQRVLWEPLLSPLPVVLHDLLLDGVWTGFAALISFVPLVAIFFMIMSCLEGSGYLSRAAYLMDALMGRLGLDGRTFVLQMMGFGCNVPAIMGTRIMRSRSMRLLAMLVIPFSLCSARLQVFIFILAAVLPGYQGAIALFLLYIVSFVTAFTVAALLSRLKYFEVRDPFVLELPPYRWPTLRQIVLRVWGEMKEFVLRLSLFMVIGSSLIWFLTAFPRGSVGLDSWAGQFGSLFQPFMTPLGLNPLLTVSLVFGFVAKEVQIAALSVLYGLSNAATTQELGTSLTFSQGFSYCLFSLIYLPCLTTLGAIWRESKSIRYTLLTIAIPLCTAWIASFLFYQGGVTKI
ncbi:ferrous iron transport protein B [Lyngbya confervoides]|uniref:Ferrous iron transport protein B n=1 Tax=Lyngbya confervoides BDU141951 TaxID=1574623 RepID=A0ABD4T279_9CYAN|nr:ferrous iron transport protein B [Lyngbya confervoides]MCM1982450.1 ferrous iron transport protein B [Lyngbya confervoides BDU141951]